MHLARPMSAAIAVRSVRSAVRPATLAAPRPHAAATAPWPAAISASAASHHRGLRTSSCLRATPGSLSTTESGGGGGCATPNEWIADANAELAEWFGETIPREHQRARSASSPGEPAAPSAERRPNLTEFMLRNKRAKQSLHTPRVDQPPMPPAVDNDLALEADDEPQSQSQQTAARHTRNHDELSEQVTTTTETIGGVVHHHTHTHTHTHHHHYYATALPPHSPPPTPAVAMHGQSEK